MLFPRENYVNKLLRHKDSDFIKVVTGIRRVGKSTILALFQEHLLKNGVLSEQIIRINLEDIRLEHLCEYHNLHDYVLEKIKETDKKCYVFIDEVQNCPQFQKAIRSLYSQKCADLYISDSNAYLLSGELATLLSGRYVEIEVFPLSFSEYIHGHEQENLHRTFEVYISTGGFPSVACEDFSPEHSEEILLAILDSVVMKDILLRNPTFSAPKMQKVIHFLAGSIGSPISVKNIANTINSTGEKTSISEIEEYVNALCLCYFFQSANSFNITGKQVLRERHKLYIIDLAMRNILVKSSREDYGHILENIVFLELRRRGYQVLVGSIYGYKIDFVAQKNADTLYIQVSASVAEQSTLDRELRVFKNIQSEQQCLLLTMDNIDQSSHDGISQQNILNWLLL